MGFIGSLTDTDASITDGSIQIKELEFGDISLGGVTVSLGGTVSEPNFDLSLASNYPSSALVGTISTTQVEDFDTLVSSSGPGTVGGDLTVEGNVYSNERTTTGGYRLPDWQVYNTSAGALSFYDSTNTAERLRITSGGLVGIGTDNPTAPLDVAGNVISNGLYSDKLMSKTTANDSSTIIGARNALGTEVTVMTVNVAGLVGIGTDNPTDALHIQTGTFDGVTTFKVKTEGQIELSRNHARKPRLDTSMSSGRPTLTLSNAEDFGTVTEKVKLNTAGDSFFNGGNIGIGSEIPAAKLDVVGSILSGFHGININNEGNGVSNDAF